MFAQETKSIVKNLGSSDLIPNKDLNKKLDFLTLVRIHQGNIWSFPKYRTLMLTLPELLEEDQFCPEFDENILVEDFTTCSGTSAGVGVGGGHDLVATGKITVIGDTVDSLATPVSFKTKTVKLKPISSRFSGRTIGQKNFKQLRLKKGDKLAFVFEMIYNTKPVKMIHNSKKGGSFSVSYQKMVNLLVKGGLKEEASFTVPKESTFAYGLMEIQLEDRQMVISLEPWNHKRNLLCLFSHDGRPSEPLNKAIDEIQDKKGLLQPLADLPKSTCSDLLEKLRKVLEDRDTLTLLEETLEQCSNGSCDCPECPAVASFMGLLDVSGISSSMKNAVYVLVSAMDTLPDEMPPLLMSCSPETLRVLNQLVDSLRKDRQAKLPESLPATLQEDGEFRWAADFLCSTNETLVEMSESWDIPAEVLLEVLCLTVQGLNMMQSGK